MSGLRKTVQCVVFKMSYCTILLILVTLGCGIGSILIYDLAPKKTCSYSNYCDGRFCNVQGWIDIACYHCTTDSEWGCDYTNICANTSYADSCCFDAVCKNVPNNVAFYICDTNTDINKDINGNKNETCPDPGSCQGFTSSDSKSCKNNIWRDISSLITSIVSSMCFIMFIVSICVDNRANNSGLMQNQ